MGLVRQQIMDSPYAAWGYHPAAWGYDPHDDGHDTTTAMPTVASMPLQMRDPGLMITELPTISFPVYRDNGVRNLIPTDILPDISNVLQDSDLERLKNDILGRIRPEDGHTSLPGFMYRRGQPGQSPNEAAGMQRFAHSMAPTRASSIEYQPYKHKGRMTNTFRAKMIRKFDEESLTGISMKAWCLQNDLAYHTFRKWVKEPKRSHIFREAKNEERQKIMGPAEFARYEREQRQLATPRVDTSQPGPEVPPPVQLPAPAQAMPPLSAGTGETQMVDLQMNPRSGAFEVASGSPGGKRKMKREREWSPAKKHRM